MLSTHSRLSLDGSIHWQAGLAHSIFWAHDRPVHPIFWVRQIQVLPAVALRIPDLLVCQNFLGCVLRLRSVLRMTFPRNVPHRRGSLLLFPCFHILSILFQL